MKIGKLLTVLACTVVIFSISAFGKSEEATDVPVTIEYFNQKKEMSETLQEITADFEKENPDIHVKVVDVPNAGEVIKTRMLGRDVPDVINMYPKSVELQE